MAAQVQVEMTSRMSDAITDGDVSEIRRLLVNGFDVNGIVKDETLLMKASRLDKAKVVRVLLEFGAEVTEGRGHLTPLVLACMRNNIEIINMLVQNMVNYIAPVNNGQTLSCFMNPLYWTVKYCNLEAAEILINHGVPVNTKSLTDLTVLHTAARNGDNDMINLLMKSGADVNIENVRGRTPLADAIMAPNPGMQCIQNLLENGAAVNGCSDNWNTPLHYAAMAERPLVELAYLLLDFGCPVNKENYQNHRPLVLALKPRITDWFTRGHGHIPATEFAQCLIKHGAIINTPEVYEALRDKLFNNDRLLNIKLLYVCIQAGLHVSRLPWLVEYLSRDYSVTEHMSSVKKLEVLEHQNLQGHFQIMRQMAPPLIRRCCVMIREHLMQVGSGTSIYFKVLQLPLPVMLKNALILEDGPLQERNTQIL